MDSEQAAKVRERLEWAEERILHELATQEMVNIQNRLDIVALARQLAHVRGAQEPVGHEAPTADTERGSGP